MQRREGRISYLDSLLQPGAELQSRDQLGHVHRGRLTPIAPHLNTKAPDIAEPDQSAIESRNIPMPATDPIVVRIALAKDLRAEPESVKSYLLAIILA